MYSYTNERETVATTLILTAYKLSFTKAII